MNSGKQIREMAAAIDEAQARQKDMLVPSKNMEMMAIAGRPVIDIEGHAFVAPTDWAHGQIGQHLGIPKAYYDRMRSEWDLDLFCENVNHWLDKDSSTRLVRLDGTDMRAFLSDRYKRIDHPVVLRQALEGLATVDNVKILSSDVTAAKMYVKALFPGLEGEVKQGDVIHPGVCISNSEIGGGSFQVSGFFYRSYCENGCVFGRNDVAEAVHRRHTGRRLQMVDGYQIYQEDTLAAEAQALAMQTRDIVKTFSSEKGFGKMLSICQAAAKSDRVDNPEKAVEVLAKEVGLNDGERTSALINLIEDKDYTKWGLANAVTKIANTTENYDRATELESMGAEILTMQLRQFEKIKVAA